MKSTADVMAHLAGGNERQQDAYRVLQESRVLLTLAAFQAYPAGTVPIDIDIPGSDLDILCEAYDLDAFAIHIERDLGNLRHFHCNRGTRSMDGTSYVTCNFQIDHWPIEIFAQAVPVQQQNAYLHMKVEWELLQLWGSEGQREIRRLKRSGLKTEPAFAQVLGLQGDPYVEMLHLATWSHTELRDWARKQPSFLQFSSMINESS
ncbi:DUF4269 domain-containing protein [Paenibacillus xylanexedens]|uniref:DUF4269 domain-containing protein n=1 Tax=Paenibacillus xylanexedens TaxID=528191 RepID=UPI0011A7489B|nr:DUF4269 domain-containing protein [Paenibacillus xylanexedens]